MEKTNSMNFSDFLQNAVDMLQRNLDLYPAFDTSKSYSEKNQYFVELAELGERCLMMVGKISAAETYFDKLKKVILKFEQDNNKVFNKGMVYADLGIAQIANHKLDAGVAHLLAADEEDRPFVHDPHGILNTNLWRQFERPNVFRFLIALNNQPDSNLRFQVGEAFLDRFFASMAFQDRLFLEATIWALYDNLSINQLLPNTYTRGKLYSGIKDLCLLTESLLRKHQIALGLIQANKQVMLGSLLASALGNKKINYPQVSSTSRANNLQDFVNNLEIILSNGDSPELRRISCLHLIRNFTGHHFDLADSIVSPSGKSFFDMYDRSLVNVLSAILYLYDIGEI